MRTLPATPLLGRVRRHLSNYRQLLEGERDRLGALASRVQGTKRAVLLARVKAIEETRRGLEDTFAEHFLTGQGPVRPVTTR